ncbi:MAP kinase kinase Wis1 [Naganishia cerealis]|uniref:MAP kinase kinase Wis1 n=1 Tax=Naganishia cerealis TaxID=610337 RepID=A0ACC2W6P0_9TREE|nr:MAP kinase kinase Wis1 [Naganishia cerealis]
MSPGQGLGQTKLPPGLQAKMDAQMARVAKEGSSAANSSDKNDPTSVSSLLASAAARATAPPVSSSPRPGPALGGLAARRAAAAAGGAGGGLGGASPSAGRPSAGPGPGLSGMGGGATPGMNRLRRPGQGLTLSSMGGGAGAGIGSAGAPFSSFKGIVDPSGRLNFQSKAVLHADGVDFSNGQSYQINKDALELQEELGKGNYGSVQKVYHKPTKVVMAMKEIRLELDESKLNGIIMELDILHRAVAPEIVEFYGAFTIESCVYYCMEYMDAGSLDRMHGDGIPEDVLARITKSMIKGLRFLKDELSVMHRDVKPTNVLVNTKGQVKLCDFGVSGQLEKSLAKTNIGCQSYMAPERIKGESQNNLGTYTVSSDVWSVGLSIIELAMGCYPYPPETYSNVFAQLQAIVHGPPPRLPEEYSDVAQDFVAQWQVAQRETLLK